MTAEDVIKGFREDAPEDAERAAYANELFQEAIRLGVTRFLLKPSKAETCTAMTMESGAILLSASACASGEASNAGIYAVSKAVHDIVANLCRCQPGQFWRRSV